MKRGQIRFSMDETCIKSKLFSNIARENNPTSFTRKSPLGIEELITILLTRKGLSTKMDLRNFYKEKLDKKKVSNVAFHKRRMKFNPEAIAFLNDNRIYNYYQTEENLKKFKNNFIIAVDGSKVVIPTTEETLEYFGGQVNQTRTVATLGLSTVYDVLNNMIFEGSINRYDYSEREAAERHINTLQEFLGEQDKIVLFDRGYLSIKLLLHLMNTDNKFIFRLSKIQFKREQKKMKSNDECIDIEFTRDRINYYRNTPIADQLKKLESINLRFIKVMLDSGEEEYLLTNLDQINFTYKDISYLYNMRWGIETVYDMLKNQVLMSNFSGKKPIIIQQDIYISIYLCNLINDIVNETQDEFETENTKEYKHEMKINKNLAIGILKSDLLRILITDDDEIRHILFEIIYDDIKSNILPVRKDRSYKRIIKTPSYKYPMSKKRSF